jgi:predicted HNH restriction endonuclease
VTAFSEKEEQMDHREDREILRRGGFAEGEMNKLTTLRRERIEKARLDAIAENRRLEFVRWLVSIGKITDQIA